MRFLMVNACQERRLSQYGRWMCEEEATCEVNCMLGRYKKHQGSPRFEVHLTRKNGNKRSMGALQSLFEARRIICPGLHCDPVAVHKWHRVSIELDYLLHCLLCMNRTVAFPILIANIFYWTIASIFVRCMLPSGLLVRHNCISSSKYLFGPHLYSRYSQTPEQE